MEVIDYPDVVGTISLVESGRFTKEGVDTAGLHEVLQSMRALVDLRHLVKPTGYGLSGVAYVSVSRLGLPVVDGRYTFVA